MAGLGALKVQGDVDTGVISYTATPRVNEIVSQYIRRAARNAAMVKLQIAVVDLRLNRDLESGFDWNKFSIDTSHPNVGVGSIHDTDLGVVNLVGGLSGSGASFVAYGSNFNLGLALKALSSYGQARTDQDLVLSTLSGSAVNIKSGNKIPYVDNIGTTSNDRSSMQSVETATVDSGLTVNVLPYFDVDAEMVTTKIDVDLSSLVAFRELSAGEGLGSISQPEMQETKFSNITRLSPGETAVLGGIAYDQVDENYTSIAGMENTKTGSKAIKTNRHAMFIMIRPTVVTYDGRKVNDQDVSLAVPADEK
jgi:MSHA biogenesis protein MshL